MTRQNIQNTLAQHYVPCRIEGDSVMALDIVIGPERQDLSTWVDVTRYTMHQMLVWLGY